MHYIVVVDFVVVVVVVVNVVVIVVNVVLAHLFVTDHFWRDASLSRIGSVSHSVCHTFVFWLKYNCISSLSCSYSQGQVRVNSESSQSKVGVKKLNKYKQDN